MTSSSTSLASALVPTCPQLVGFRLQSLLTISSARELRLSRGDRRLFLQGEGILAEAPRYSDQFDRFLYHGQYVNPFSIDYRLHSLVVSLTTCDLGVVLEIAGGLSATALAFIVSHHVIRNLQLS